MKARWNEAERGGGAGETVKYNGRDCQHYEY